METTAWAISRTTVFEKHSLPTQGPHIASNVRENCYIRYSLPKLKLSEFSDDLLEASVNAPNMDDKLKMVTKKAKKAIAGLGYTAEVYNVA